MSLKGWKVEESEELAPWQIEYSKQATGKAAAQAPQKPPEEKPAAAEKQCPACGTKTVPFAKFCPRCGHSFEVRPAEPPADIREFVQPCLAPRPPAPAPAPVPSPPPAQWAPVAPPAPTADQRMPVQGMRVKSPQLAMFLALVPGLVLFMGLGHFYTRRWIKGIFLFIAGGFLGTMSYFSLAMLLLEPASGIELAATLVVMALFTVPWLILLVWSVVDAPKAAKKLNEGYAGPVY